jgi:glutathione S-transferase
MKQKLVIYSHPTCAYGQRPIIMMKEKGVPFEHRHVDQLPCEFEILNPHGKSGPVLLAGEQPIYLAKLICEYLDEAIQPSLRPSDPLERAHYGYAMEYGTWILELMKDFHNAKDATVLGRHADKMQTMIDFFETRLESGPFYAGSWFSVVDVVFGPIFRYLNLYDRYTDFDFLAKVPKMRKWGEALLTRDSIATAVPSDIDEQLHQSLISRNSEFSKRMSH